MCDHPSEYGRGISRYGIMEVEDQESVLSSIVQCCTPVSSDGIRNKALGKGLLLFWRWRHASVIFECLHDLLAASVDGRNVKTVKDRITH